MSRPPARRSFVVCLLVLTFSRLAAAQSPTITSVSPSVGTANGGNQVTISGTNLQTVTSVTFGGAAALVFGGPPDGSSLFVAAPVHAAGTVDVVATNPSGSATLLNGFQYLAPAGPAPTVTSVTPNRASPLRGTPITITGTNFVPGATVQIGNNNALNVVVSSPTTITAETPDGFTASNVPIIVTLPDAQFAMLIGAFTFSPNCDATILMNCISQLDVDGLPAPIGIAAELLRTPQGDVQVSIVNNANADRYELAPAATSASLITFSFVVAPSISDRAAVLSTGNIESWTWNAGARIATVHLRPRASSWSTAGCVVGACPSVATNDYSALALAVLLGFDDADLDFSNDMRGAFLSTNAQTFSTPDYNPLTQAFSFTVGAPSQRLDGTANDNGFFTFFVPDDFIIDWWGVANPNDLLNPANSLVTIGGSVVVPTITDVAATATTPDGIRFEFQPFHYSVEEIKLIVAPSVTSIAPVSGPTAGATNVTITGTNFRAGATVTIGGVPATNVVVVDNVTITARTGAHAAGTTDVVVTNSDTTSDTLSNAFTFVPPPAVTGVAPNSGKLSGGTVISISGTGFQAGAAVSVGGTAATSVTVVNSTTINATTPAHATGAVNIVVTNPDAQAATVVNGFTYNPLPTLVSITPASGTTAGGTPVTIMGTGFLANATVSIGGVAATNVAIVNANTITATTGAHAAGATSVIVTNADTQSVTMAGAYSYVDPEPPPSPSPATPSTPSTPSTPTTPVPPANQAPTISGLSNMSMPENTTTTVAFTIADDATSAASLAVSASSSNTILLPSSGIAVGGSGASRTLTITPGEDRDGDAFVTVTVSDGELTANLSVLVSVVPGPAPNAPSSLIASADNTRVSFSWSAPAGGPTPTFYVLEGGSAPGINTLPSVNTQSRDPRWTMELPAGQYFFRVRAGNRRGTSEGSNEASFTVVTSVLVPGAPGSLSVRVAESVAELRWEPPASGAAAEAWQIELDSVTAAADRSTFTVPADVFSIRGTLAFGNYAARVRGVNRAGSGAASNEARFSVVDGATCSGAVPDSPVALPASVSGRFVTASWRAPTNAVVANYRLFVGSSAGAGDLAVFDAGSITSLATEAAPGTYYLTVVASNGCGSSGPSNSVQVVVAAPGARPAPPANVRAVVSGQRVSLAWDGVEGAASYLIEVGTTTGATDVAALPVAATALVLETAPSGVYFVRVRAVGSGGTSDASAEIVVTVP